MTYTIVGVTGHIDHGKTTLVRALTGCETDTHPEEKRRGITIDIGFAKMTIGEHEFSLVDAPGHQKYVGNLLAGVSRVDVGLLVVAADQGIQAQTIEHAAILGALGVGRLVVAISRSDLADEMTCGALEEELLLFLADVGFHEFPMIRVSGVRGDGLLQLRETLIEMAKQTSRTSRRDLPMRMPIDRVLNVPGRGLVVAGTIWTGNLSLGESVVLLPGESPLRVREIEQHGAPVDHSFAGRRTAVNLVGTSRAPQRGDELVAADSYQLGNRFLVELKLFPDTAPIRLPGEALLHAGTSARQVRLTGPKKLTAEGTQVVLLEAEDPLIGVIGQPLLLRRPYPTGAVAGGRFLAALESGKFQRKRAMLLGQQLAESDCSESRLAAWVQYAGQIEVACTQLASQLQLNAAEISRAADKLVQSERILRVGGRLVSYALLEGLEKSVLAYVAQLSEQLWVPLDAVVAKLSSRCHVEVAQVALAHLVKSGALVEYSGQLAAADRVTNLSRRQRQQLDDVVAGVGGLRAPPTAAEWAKQLDTSVKSFQSMVRFAVQTGSLVEVGGVLYYDPQTHQGLVEELAQLLDSDNQATVAEIRDLWGLSRKHVIPLLEDLDRRGMTLRVEQVRRATSRLLAVARTTQAIDPASQGRVVDSQSGTENA